MAKLHLAQLGVVFLLATGAGVATIGYSKNAQDNRVAQEDKENAQSTEDRTNRAARSAPVVEQLTVSPRSRGFWELSQQIQRDRVFLHQVRSPWKCGGWDASVPEPRINRNQSVAKLLQAMASGKNVKLEKVQTVVGLHYLYYEAAPDKQLEKFRQALASDDPKVRQNAFGRPGVGFDLRMVRILTPYLARQQTKALASSLLRVYVGTVPAALMLPKKDALVFLENELSNGNVLALAGLGYIGDGKSTSLLESALTKKDKDLRIAAVRALQFIPSDRARRALTSVVADEHVEVRKAVAKALSWFEDQAARRALKKLIADEDSTVRSSAASALGWHGPAANELLAKTLLDETPAVRQATVVALGKIGDQAAVNGLETAFRDENQFVRERASESLAHIGGPAVLSVMEKAVLDKRDQTRWLAAATLAELGGDESLKLLKKLLDDPDLYVRQRAVHHLGSFEGDEIFALLKKASETYEGYHIQSAAARALGQLGGDKAVAMLSELLDKNTGTELWDVRRIVAYSLGTIGSDRAIRRLKKMLHEEKPGKAANQREAGLVLAVRRGIIYALGMSGNHTAIPLLEGELKNDERAVRQDAMTALGRLGGADARDLLIAHLDVRPADKQWVHAALRDWFIGDEKVRRILGFNPRSP